ncbi:MAG: VWA domain-containing protein, partial [Oligoflexia bacterium]|nr:VWA domain-containing protein [Oligoflexia bacterium]
MIIKNIKHKIKILSMSKILLIKNKPIKLYLILCCLFFFISDLDADFKANTNVINSPDSKISKDLRNSKQEIIIIFDQSGSLKKFDYSKLPVESWHNTILKAYKHTYKITLIGFDERIHLHLKTEVNGKSNSSKQIINVLSNKLKEVKNNGYTTDLERPFKYLLEMDNLKSIKLAILISDGEPDIFDKKLKYLSLRIRKDRRYSDLISQYDLLEESEESSNRKYNYSRYSNIVSQIERRNISLATEKVSQFKDILGKKLIIWDVSGKLPYLKNWASLAGAQYLSSKNAGESAKTSEQALKKVVYSIDKMIQLLDEELKPSKFEQKIEKIFLKTSPTDETATGSFVKINLKNFSENLIKKIKVDKNVIINTLVMTFLMSFIVTCMLLTFLRRNKIFSFLKNKYFQKDYVDEKILEKNIREFINYKIEQILNNADSAFNKITKEIE